MIKDGESDSPERSHEQRRRRIEMRRLAEVRRIHAAEDTAAASSPPEAAAPAAEKPVYGTVSVSGRSRRMEDAVAVRTEISWPEITGKPAVHFFAVYDGHGGRHVAELCKRRMHVILEEEMARVGYARGNRASGGEKEEEEERWSRRVIERSFERMDEEATITCTCGDVAYRCGCQSVEFPIGGSTATVALLTSDHIAVANVGDSRAVLYRGGRILPLSDDHKPDRSDELARIEAAGGRVIKFVNGARVEGILAMSRAIGDNYLKPYVISTPEITFTKREAEDECLIIASDGLWDVLSNELACKVASECLREEITSPATAQQPPLKEEALYPSRSALAAALLARLALSRRSSDNISVIVVDLKLS